MMKRFVEMFLLAVIMSAAAISPAMAAVPQVNASGAVVIDMVTGAVLWEQNGYSLLEPASTTKILTALVTMDMNALARQTTVSEAAALVGESSANLQSGESFSVGELLKGALVKSANDACFAIGEAVAGSEPLFVDWMELKANSLGAFDAVLANTNGLPAENHLLSAYDLALIARQCMQYESFREIVSSQHITMSGGNYNRTFKNTNKLLSSNEYVIGIKTGTTNNAGACLVSAMNRDGREVIAVVLHSGDRYGESLQLLNYGIEEFSDLSLVTAGEQLGYLSDESSKEGGVAAIAEDDLMACLPKSAADALQYEYCWRSRSELGDIARGELLGTLRFRDGNGNLLGATNLIAADSLSYGFLARLRAKLDGRTE